MQSFSCLETMTSITIPSTVATNTQVTLTLPEGKVFSDDTKSIFTPTADTDLSDKELVRGGYFGTGNSGKWNITGTGDLTTNLNDAVNIPANAFSGFTATINAGVGLAVVVNNKVLGAGSINGATKVFTLSDDFTLKRRRSFAHQRHAHHQRLRDSKSLLPRHGLTQRRDQRHNRRQGWQ